MRLSSTLLPSTRSMQNIQSLWADEVNTAAQLGSQSCMHMIDIYMTVTQYLLLIPRQCTPSDADLILRIKN